MNQDRRAVCALIMMVLEENDSISDEAADGLGTIMSEIKKAEYHQLRVQEKHEGKNASTDKQVAICRVALPALEAAVEAWNNDDHATVITQLGIAATTDGTVPRKRKARRARK